MGEADGTGKPRRKDGGVRQADFPMSEGPNLTNKRRLIATVYFSFLLKYNDGLYL